MSDSFSAFKLHSLSTPNSTLNSPAPPKIIPFCICTHCTKIISLTHPLGDEASSTSRGLHGQSQQSSRWSPTPAQLLVLEELYRQGTKTPTAEQIQQIASQLRRFGKIEGKNVFYWFQNHKARERQKRRRREMEETASDSAEDKELYVANVRSSEEKQDSTGLRGTGYQVKQTKKWGSSSNCSALPQETADSRPKGWTQLEEKRTQVLKPEQTTPLSQKFSSENHNLPLILNRENCTYCDEEEEYSNTRTLELFPLKRGDQYGMSLNDRKSKLCASTSLGTEIATSSQFFEFLPLKD